MHSILFVKSSVTPGILALPALLVTLSAADLRFPENQWEASSVRLISALSIEFLRRSRIEFSSKDFEHFYSTKNCDLYPS